MPRLLTHPYFVLQSSEFVQELLLIRSINKREKKWFFGFFYQILAPARSQIASSGVPHSTEVSFIFSLRTRIKAVFDSKTQNAKFL